MSKDLTKAQADRIRWHYKHYDVRVRDLAAVYNVNSGVISKVLQYKIYRPAPRECLVCTQCKLAKGKEDFYEEKILP
jgi:hypothetical protein